MQPEAMVHATALRQWWVYSSCVAAVLVQIHASCYTPSTLVAKVLHAARSNGTCCGIVAVVGV